MPAPSSAQIQALANSALQQADLRGENSADLAKALGQGLQQALLLFQSSAQILPGVAAALDPVSGAGSVVGPGILLPPPAGGPTAGQLQGIMMGALSSAGLMGEHIDRLAGAIAAAFAQAVQLFTSTVKSGPGIPVAAFITVAPGRLLPPSPSATMIEPITLGILQQEQILGERAPDLAAALAQTFAGALDAFAQQIMVLPGIACTPAATVTPGRLG